MDRQVILTRELMRAKGLRSGKFQEIKVYERYQPGVTSPSSVTILGNNGDAAPGDVHGRIHIPGHESGRYQDLKVVQTEDSMTNDVLWVGRDNGRGPNIDQGDYSTPRYDERTMFSRDSKKVQVAHGRMERTYTGRVGQEIELLPSGLYAVQEIAPRVGDLATTVTAANDLLERALEGSKAVEVIVNIDRPTYTRQEMRKPIAPLHKERLMKLSSTLLQETMHEAILQYGQQTAPAMPSLMENYPEERYSSRDYQYHPSAGYMAPLPKIQLNREI